MAAAFISLFFDPRSVMIKCRGIPYFIRNARRYSRLNADTEFRIRPRELIYTTSDRFAPAGAGRGHYLHQDLWAARQRHDRGVRNHVDVGSRVDGFIAHILPFCNVTYVDIRALPATIPGLEFREGSITSLPFNRGSIPSISCLHVIEHIGLGRYGDSVEPKGYLIAAAELGRVLAPGGTLLLSTPVGKQRLCFDAHRIFDPQTVLDAFANLELVEFNLINDTGLG